MTDLQPRIADELDRIIERAERGTLGALLWRIYDTAVEALLVVKWHVREFMGSKW